MDDRTADIFSSKRKRIRKWWEQLSYLEQKLIISLGIIGLVLLLILLILIIQSATSPKICKTSNCIIAAAEIVRHTNPTVDPCHDFYQFTCQKLNEPSIRNMQVTIEQVEEDLINLLAAPVTSEDRYELKTQKHLFEMCLNKSEGEKSLSFTKALIEELHGWPVALGFNWKAGFFDWKNTVIQLRQRGLPFNMLISVELVPSEDINKQILCIGKPKAVKIQQENLHEYRRLMSEVAVAFGAEKSRAGSDMRRVLDFMIELYKLTEINQTNKKFKLVEIQNHFTEVNWINFLNGILGPNSSIHPEEYVLAPSHKFMQALLNLINRTPKRVQANYIIWIIIEKYLPFLSEKLKHLHSNYAHSSDLVTAAPERWHVQQCNSIISNSFLTPPSEIVYAANHLKQIKIDEVLEMGKHLQTVFEMFLKESTWFNEITRIKALVKIQSLKLIGGLHVDPENNRIPALDQNKSFLSNLLNNTRNKYELIYGQITPMLSLPIYTTDVMYLPESNVLFLPVAAYLEESPVYLNYGQIGAVISQRLVREFLPEDERQWTDHAFDSSECMLQKNNSADLKNLLDVIGNLLSHAAYQLWKYGHTEEDHLIGLHYTPNQLFWISSFLGYCTKHHDKNALVNTITQAHPSFAEDFECPWGSPMNPLENCNIFK